MDDVVLTPEELSSRWKNLIKPNTLSNWRQNGKGPKFVKLGNNVGYTIAEVEKYEKRRLKKSTKE